VKIVVAVIVAIVIAGTVCFFLPDRTGEAVQAKPKP
jgi:hypothetical protein